MPDPSFCSGKLFIEEEYDDATCQLARNLQVKEIIILISIKISPD